VTEAAPTATIKPADLVAAVTTTDVPNVTVMIIATQAVTTTEAADVHDLHKMTDITDQETPVALSVTVKRQTLAIATTNAHKAEM